MASVFKPFLLLVLSGSLISPAVGRTFFNVSSPSNSSASSPSNPSASSPSNPSASFDNPKWQFSGEHEAFPVINHNTLLFPHKRISVMHTDILAFVVKQIITDHSLFIKLIPEPCNRFNESEAKWAALANNLPVHNKAHAADKLLRSEYIDAVIALRSAAIAVKTCIYIHPEWLALLDNTIVQLALDSAVLTGIITDASGFDSIPAYLTDIPMSTFHELLAISSWNVSAPLGFYRWHGQSP